MKNSIQPAEGGSLGSGDELRHNIADGIGERGENQSADDVPAGDEEIARGNAEEGFHELNDHQRKRQDDEEVDYQRKLGPLQRLAEAHAYQHPTWKHHGEVPYPEYRPAELAAGDRTVGQAGYYVITKGDEGITEPAEEDSLGMVVAQSSPCLPRMAAHEVGEVELGGYHNPEERGDNHRD